MAQDSYNGLFIIRYTVTVSENPDYGAEFPNGSFSGMIGNIIKNVISYYIF